MNYLNNFYSYGINVNAIERVLNAKTPKKVIAIFLHDTLISYL